MSRKATYQESLKTDILRHTLTLAGEEGWTGVSTRKIADRLQTSTTAIYHYFGGKEAILVELQREGFRQLCDLQLTALAGRAGKPRKQLKAVSLAMLHFARENPERYALMFNLDGAVCRHDEEQESAEGMRQVQAVLGQLTNDDVESVFVHWFAMMQGFIALARHDCHPEQAGRFEKLVDEGSPLAGLIAAAINAVLFYIGTATGAVPADLVIPNAGQPLTLIPVIVASFIPAIAAGLVLALLNRFTKRPLRIFTIIAVILLVFSFSSPFSIPGVPVGMIVILNLMHVVVAGAVLVAFNRLANR